MSSELPSYQQDREGDLLSYDMGLYSHPEEEEKYRPEAPLVLLGYHFVLSPNLLEPQQFPPPVPVSDPTLVQVSAQDQIDDQLGFIYGTAHKRGRKRESKNKTPEQVEMLYEELNKGTMSHKRLKNIARRTGLKIQQVHTWINHHGGRLTETKHKIL